MDYIRLDMMEREDYNPLSTSSYYCFIAHNVYFVVHPSSNWEVLNFCGPKDSFSNNISDRFEDWKNPTLTEISLFELEFGIDYIDKYLGLDRSVLKQ